MLISEVISNKGSNTPDNQDVVLAAQNGNIYLYSIMDGCSTRAKSGEFAREMSDLISAKFSTLSASQLASESIRLSLIDIFEVSRNQLKLKYMSSSMSIAVLVVIAKRVALLMHVGDCAIGLENSRGKLCWLTHPHSVVNKPIPKLIGDPYRHFISRSFKAKCQNSMDWVVRPFNVGDCYVLASDGWWDSSNALLNNSAVMSDDASVLRIKRLK